jgi:hypothetical protein
VPFGSRAIVVSDPLAEPAGRSLAAWAQSASKKTSNVDINETNFLSLQREHPGKQEL